MPVKTPIDVRGFRHLHECIRVLKKNRITCRATYSPTNVTVGPLPTNRNPQATSESDRAERRGEWREQVVGDRAPEAGYVATHIFRFLMDRFHRTELY